MHDIHTDMHEKMHHYGCLGHTAPVSHLNSQRSNVIILGIFNPIMCAANLEMPVVADVAAGQKSSQCCKKTLGNK